jgi:hypothetical protein
MSALLTALLASAAIGLCTASLSAAPAGTMVQRSFTPHTQLTQSFFYGDRYYGEYRPACPDRYYYTCWFDQHGNRHCGCRPDLAYYLFRFY